MGGNRVAKLYNKSWFFVARSEIFVSAAVTALLANQFNFVRINASKSSDLIGGGSTFFLFLFFPIPFIIFARLFSLPPSRNSDPGSHSRLPPYPLGFVPCIFYCEKISALSSLVDARRIVITHARRFQQLILFSFLRKNSKSRHGGIRTHGPTLLIVAFEGYHYSDRLSVDQYIPGRF